MRRLPSPLVAGEGTIEATLGTDQLDVRSASRDCWVLVLAWSREEPNRVGEVALVDRPGVLGRGPGSSDDDARRVGLARQRPDQLAGCPPIHSPRISRAQLLLDPLPASLHLSNIGRCPLYVNGASCDAAEVTAGDTIRLGKELVLLVSRRAPMLPPLRSYPRELGFGFGAPDPDGVVGESPAVWRLRDELAFAARATANVLLLGPSGAGKELAARTIHRLSDRGDQPLVSRNAATFPAGIIDAELFGNVRNYPNAGTPERDGLIGRADGGTLFLDEIGELSPQLQAHFLRVLDADGEYQRLGDTAVRRADFRVIAATNRDPGELKHDFAARLTLRIRIPTLAERREDIPLLVVHLLARMSAAHADLEAGAVQVDARMMEALLRHDYRLQVRELEQILWCALAERNADILTLTPGVEELLAEPSADSSGDSGVAADDAAHDSGLAAAPEPTRDDIETALAQSKGSVTAAARVLGLKNRFVLYRLMRKHGLERG